MSAIPHPQSMDLVKSDPSWIQIEKAMADLVGAEAELKARESRCQFLRAVFLEAQKESDSASRKYKAASYGKDEALTEKLRVKMEDREQRLAGLNNELQQLAKPAREAKVKLQEIARSNLDLIPRIELRAVVAILHQAMPYLENCLEMFRYEDNLKQTATLAGRELAMDWSNRAHPGHDLRTKIRALALEFETVGRTHFPPGQVP